MKHSVAVSLIKSSGKEGCLSLTLKRFQRPVNSRYVAVRKWNDLNVLANEQQANELLNYNVFVIIIFPNYNIMPNYSITLTYIILIVISVINNSFLIKFSSYQQYLL